MMMKSLCFTLFTVLSLGSACTNRSTPIDRTIRVGWENAPRTADPRYAVDADSQYLNDFLHCSLISWSPEGGIQMRLAKNYQWKNATTLEVTLEQGFEYEKGRPVIAEDVKANFDALKADLADPTPLRASFANLKEVKTLSDSKLEFYLEEPDGDFIQNLSIGLLPKEQALLGKIDQIQDFRGCGDFKVEQWEVSHLLLKRKHEDSSKDVQFIRIEIIKDENTRFLKLRNSELDLVQNSLFRDQLSKIENFSHLKLARGMGLNTAYLAFQFDDPLLKVREVREAIASSIDRDKLIEHILRGWAKPAKTILTPDSPFYSENVKGHAYDPERAKSLLDQVGFPMKGDNKDQPRFALTLKTTTNPTRTMIAHAVADELKKVGIALRIESLDWGKFKSDIDKGAAQLWTLNWIGFKGPDIYRYAFSTDAIPPNGANRGRFSHPGLDSLLTRAKKEVRQKERTRLYHQVQEIIEKEVPYVFLWHEEQFAVLNERVEGFKIYADGRLSSLPDVKLLKKGK